MAMSREQRPRAKATKVKAAKPRRREQYLLQRIVEFDAAHRLPGHPGKCRNLHGHRWRVEVVIRGEADTATGMVVDFGTIKAAIMELDHKTILAFDDPLAPQIAGYDCEVVRLDVTPTAEHLAEYLAIGIIAKASLAKGSLVGVTVEESPGASATYRTTVR